MDRGLPFLRQVRRYGLDIRWIYLRCVSCSLVDLLDRKPNRRATCDFKIRVLVTAGYTSRYVRYLAYGGRLSSNFIAKIVTNPFLSVV